MKIIKQLLFLTLTLSFVLVACDKDDNNNNSYKVDPVWKEANETAFTKVAANSAYTKLESQSKNGFIMYKEINKGTGVQKPIFTDRVKVKYTGWYKGDWTKGDTYTDEKQRHITNKITFDSSLIDPAMFQVSGVVDGFSTALQHMVVGDKWEVWIPWKLAYGAAGNRDGYGNVLIKGHTMLVFEIELVEIVK